MTLGKLPIPDIYSQTSLRVTSLASHIPQSPNDGYHFLDATASSLANNTMDPPTLPAIRTAMRMSRNTGELSKSAVFPTEQDSLFLLRNPFDGSQKTRGGLPLWPVAVEPRSPRWKEILAAKGHSFLGDWETEECKLESDSLQMSDCSVSTRVVNTSAHASVGVLGTKKRPILFRPKPLKFLSQKTCIGPASVASVPALSTPTSLKRTHSLSSRVKEAPVLRKPMSKTSSAALIPLPALPLKPAVQTLKTNIVLRLTQIDSNELDESENEAESVLMHLQAQRKPRRSSYEQWMDPLQRISDAKCGQRYSEETAHVLGDTKSLVKRRSMQMKVPKRLFRHVSNKSFA